MDVYPYVILILISVIQVAHQAASPGSANGKNESGDGHPTDESDVCRVKVECSKDSPSSKHFKSLSDENKISGDRGLPGLNGPKGETGDRVLPGLNGPKGETGDRGLNGDKGIKGEMGEKGEKGECVTKSAHPMDPEESGAALGETEDNPAKSCKDLIGSGGPPATYGSYYIKENDPFHVKCEFEDKLTCLDLNDVVIEDHEIPGKLITINPAHEEYILTKLNTENPFNITTYYNINYRQLKWFQSQAKSKIKQIIRFHCKNVVVRSSNVTRNMRLLSWNQKYIDIEGTVDDSLTYKILSPRDECEEFDEDRAGPPVVTPKYNEIEIEAYPEYLPITGFVIRDIQPDKEQSFYVETVRLCADF
ncbi:uncharacterized protein [Epargyreus clarus]|uniref:uncharacterized protein n=1 Tax=Epargyreus clarus TaxID=520877 RepID=UPI003C2B7D7E